jgi:hypothetical protein
MATVTNHDLTIRAIMLRAMYLAERAGEEQDPLTRAVLLHECMIAWQRAQALRRYPDRSARA